MRRGATIICESCGGEAPRRGNVQRYCLICSAAKSTERKAKWRCENPFSDEEKQRRLKVKEERDQVLRELGAATGASQRHSIHWLHDAPELLWTTRVSVPFDYGYSKNAIYNMGGHHVALRQRTRQLRDVLIAKMRQSLETSGPAIVPAKVWIDVLVQKPDHKGDAINVVDTVCDALKEAIGLDDRWFSIYRLDWEIVKTDPRLFVGIGQTTLIPHRVCSYCGLIKPRDDNFRPRKHIADGFSRVCTVCSKISSRISSRNLRARRAVNEGEVQDIGQIYIDNTPVDLKPDGSVAVTPCPPGYADGIEPSPTVRSKRRRYIAND